MQTYLKLRRGTAVVAVWAVVAIAGLTTVAVAIPAAQSRPAPVARDLAQAPPESVGVSSERLARLEAWAKGLADEGRVAGIVTMMARHGKIVHVGVAGKKDIRQSDPIARDSIFRIYSMTKVVAGAAMMMLYEEGKWRLDEPVSRHIPELAKLQVYTGANPDGTFQTEQARRPMTMRELMTHTAGLGYVLSPAHPVNRQFIERRVLDPSRPLQNMIDEMAKLPLLSQPGARWTYSSAVDVQGYLVEKFSGMGFDEVLERRIFEPLGMKDTAFHVPPDKIARLARIHGEKGGVLTPPDEERGAPEAPVAGPSGGGGLYSTADDYLRFAQMLLNEGELDGVRLLAPRSVEMLRTNHVMPEALATMQPGRGWGLGPQVIVDAALAGEPYSDGSYHWYGIGGTWFWIDPVEDFVFVGMIQHDSLGTAGRIHGISRQLAYQAIVN